MAKHSARYVPALDGLRALAVLAVIAYHMKASWAPGGLLGVTMFFVLSGYLITSLLLKEHNQSKTISLRNFWIRRVRRIIPAVLFAVLGIACLCAMFNHVLLTKMRPDVIPTLLFVNNWWQIFHDVSYFEALGSPSPLTHFWSLAIEEQFYLVWPVILIICFKAGASEKAMRRGTLALALLSILEMALLFDPAADPSRVYYGTDTRAFSLLIGAYLAFVWPYHKLGENAGSKMSPLGKTCFNLIGIASVAGLLVMVALSNGFSPFMYRGGLALCSVLTALAIAIMVHPISWISKFFELKPLVWIGKCSYSMYLWHYPIILLMTPSGLVGSVSPELVVLQLAVIFALSAFSYFLVEEPIRRGGISLVAKAVRERKLSPLGLGMFVGAPLAIVFAFTSVAASGLLFTPDEKVNSNMEALQQNEPEETVPTEMFSELNLNPYDALLIGDSVPVPLTWYDVFHQVFPYGHSDSRISRQMSDGIDVYRQYRDEGAVGDVVILALATNGIIRDEVIDQFMAEIGNEKHVWLVNAQGPLENVPLNNATLDRAAERYGNVQVIDWNEISTTLGAGAIADDGIHLMEPGSWDYANMLYDAVKDYLPQHSEDERKPDEVLEKEGERLRSGARKIEMDMKECVFALFGKMPEFEIVEEEVEDPNIAIIRENEKAAAEAEAAEEAAANEAASADEGEGAQEETYADSGDPANEQ